MVGVMGKWCFWSGVLMSSCHKTTGPGWDLLGTLVMENGEGVRKGEGGLWPNHTLTSGKKRAQEGELPRTNLTKQNSFGQDSVESFNQYFPPRNSEFAGMVASASLTLAGSSHMSPAEAGESGTESNTVPHQVIWKKLFCGCYGPTLNYTFLLAQIVLQERFP
jgi:hypothetical protein